MIIRKHIVNRDRVKEAKSERGGRKILETVSNWILKTGTWNNSGQWEFTSKWIF